MIPFEYLDNTKNTFTHIIFRKVVLRPKCVRSLRTFDFSSNENNIEQFQYKKTIAYIKIL